MLENLSLRRKLISLFTAIAILTMVIVTITTEIEINNNLNDLNQTADEILRRHARDKLSILMSQKKNRITEHFTRTKQFLNMIALDNVTAEIFSSFSKTFSSVKTMKDSPNRSLMREKLWNTYHLDFDEAYKQTAGTTHPKLKAYFSRLSDDAIAHQYHYLHLNPHPLAFKHDMMSAKIDSAYDKEHHHYHRHFMTQISAFNHENIYLIDADNGNIVYSAKKSIDLATSLLSGPFSKSKLGECFREAKASRGDIIFKDVLPYLPNLDRPSGFAGAPILTDGKVIAVIVIQLSVEPINAIMLNADGLGKTGDNYLVGSDRLLRSNSLRHEGMTVKNSFQDPVKYAMSSPVVAEGLNRKTGFYIGKNFSNVNTLSAYCPVETSGFNWTLITEISKDEIFEDLTQLNDVFSSGQEHFLVVTIIADLITIILVVLLAMFVSRYLEEPFHKVAKTCNDIATSARRMSEELAGVSSSNAEMGSVIREIASSSGQTSKSASQTVEIAKQSEASIQALGYEADQINEVLESIQEIADKTDLLALNATIEAATAGEAGKGFSVVATEVQQLANKTAEAAEQITNKISHIQDQLEFNIRQTQQVADSNREIEEATTSLASAIEEISLTIDSVNQSTDQTSDLTSDVTTEIMEVREEMQFLIHGREPTKTTKKSFLSS